MQQISYYISEKLRLNQDTAASSYIMHDSKGKEFAFEPATKKRDQVFNDVFVWLSKHCYIDVDAFNAVRCQFEINRILFHTNDYELNSVRCWIYPTNKKLIQSQQIKGHFKELMKEYENGLKDNEIFGTLVPPGIAARNCSAYGDLIFTKKGIIWGYIDDYPLIISNEILV